MTYRAPRADHGQAVVGLLADGYPPPWAPWTDSDFAHRGTFAGGGLRSETGDPGRCRAAGESQGT